LRYELDELRQILNNLEQVGRGRGIFVISPGPFSPFTRPPCPSYLSLSLLLLFSFPLRRSPENPQPATTAVRLAGKPGRDHSGPCAPPTPPPTPPFSFPSKLHRHLHLLLTSHAAITTESSPQSASPVAGDHLAQTLSRNRPRPGRFWREDGSNARPNSHIHGKILSSILLKVASPP